MGKFIDLTGQTFGRLTVLRRAEYRKSDRIRWLCICNCPDKKLVSIAGNELKNGDTKSCGCYNIERIKATHSHKFGEASFNKIFYHYKRNAKVSKREFKLTKEEFRKLIKQNCFYCNGEPNSVSDNKGNGVFVYNGIDRIDNTHGYFLENVVTCCGMCNRMKWAYSSEDFKQQIINIYNYFVLQPDIYSKYTIR